MLRFLLGDDPFDDDAILRRVRLLAYHCRIPQGNVATHADLGRVLHVSRRRASQLLARFAQETEGTR
jgi:hypothetical protein